MRRITEKNPKQFQKDINDIIQFKKSIYEYIFNLYKNNKETGNIAKYFDSLIFLSPLFHKCNFMVEKFF